MGEHERSSSEPQGWWRRLDTWQQLAGIVGTLTGVVALLLALGVVQPFDETEVTPASDPGEEEIPHFDDPAGHLVNSEDLLSFLHQHDGEAVELDVAFPELATGPAGGDNVVAETVPADGGGTLYVPTWIQLMTECEPSAPPPDENPTVTDGCLGTALSIDGPITEDSGGHFEHGVPVLDGYFLVDVSNYLQMGITPIGLRPLTFAQASA